MRPVTTIISATIGWSYFACWSLSFYPQIVSNSRRKSVVGLSFDFAITNLLGFACYSVYCSALAWNRDVRQSYADRFDSNSPQVTVQDACFALHALACSAVVCAQCVLLERHHQQRVSRKVVVGVAMILFVTLCYALLTATMLSSWLGWLYWLSLVKLGVTLFKYVPQAYLNYSRKSTVGWAVGNVLLDLSGGILSLAQTIFEGYCFGWTGVYANPIKFALGFVSIVYDLLFLLQHYVLYYHQQEQAKDHHHHHQEPLLPDLPQPPPSQQEAEVDNDEDVRKLV